MTGRATTWHEGQRIRARGEAWAVRAVTRYRDCVELRLHGVDRDNAGAAIALLCPFDRPTSLGADPHVRVVRPRRWLHSVRRLACDTRPFGALHDSAAITILPYQLEPALAFLRKGATRVLVADGVGLGKTIQAGLLLIALLARHPSCRALIVTPAGLREQWAEEMRARFGIEATVAGSSWLRLSATELPPDVVPWALPGIFITSYDFLKRPEVLRPVEDLAWDILVADEAHNASPGTARRAALHRVALRSTRVLLLTATPHGGEAGQLDSLCAIGASKGEPAIVVFQRSGAEVGRGTPRRTVLMRVRATPSEQQMHRALARYASALRRSGNIHGPARLAAVVLEKRALSSAASLAESVRRRMDLLAGDDEPRQVLLPLGDEDPLDDEVSDSVLAVPGLADASLERRLLDRVVRAALAVAPESKPAFLLRLLARVREPAIVFTEYRDTLRRIERALVQAGIDVTVMHGGLSAEERGISQRRFRTAGGVLLATDAAAEGLNLHERCRLVIHHELPWSPMRLEQRAGRVDRIGQAKKVHEIMLVSGEPAERLVLAPLARRAARIRSEGGAASRMLEVLTESAVADAILSRTPLTDELATPPAMGHTLDLRVDALAEADRIGRCREWRAQSPPPAAASGRPPGLLVTRIHRRQSRGTVTCVYKVSLQTRDGRIVHEELVPTREALTTDVTSVQMVAQSQRDNTSALSALFAARLAQIDAAHVAVEEALERRARLLQGELPSAARTLVQAGLFDRRALRRLEARDRGVAAIVEQLDTQAEQAAASQTLIRTVELVAVLLA